MLKTVFEKTPELWEDVKVNSPLPTHISAPIDVDNGVLYFAIEDFRIVTGYEFVTDYGFMAH